MKRISLPENLRPQIEFRPTASLHPYPNNALHHPREQVKEVAKSIQTWGWTNPIIVDRDGNVICGHCRLEAAKLLGLETVPVIILDNMSEGDRRAYIIADNALARKAGWSKKLLASELQGLIDIGYDVELTMLGSLTIDSLLSIDADESETPDDIVELPRHGSPISRVGDLWTVGNHCLLVGDARSPDGYDRVLQGNLAQLVFTDPPYGCKIARNVSGLGTTKHDDFIIGSDGRSAAKFTNGLLRPAFRCIAAYSQPGAIGYVCMDWRGAPMLLDAAQGVFLEPKNMVVWCKTNAGMGTFYRSQHELIYVFPISQGPTINNFQLGQGGRHRSNVWTYAGANTFRRGRMDDLADHPTCKPKKLVADALLDCSMRGGAVLDPFAGSGTTLVSAEMTGRRGYGIELDPRFCDVILRRLEEATGKPACLEDGTTFAEAAMARRVAA